MAVDISTDVDNLLEVLQDVPRRAYTIAQLAELSGLGEKAVKKWINKLEEHGKVRVDYDLTREMVTWVADFPQKEEPDLGLDERSSILEGAETRMQREIEMQRRYQELLDEKKMLLEQMRRIDEENKKTEMRRMLLRAQKEESVRREHPEFNSEEFEDTSRKIEEIIAKMDQAQMLPQETFVRPPLSEHREKLVEKSVQEIVEAEAQRLEEEMEKSGKGEDARGAPEMQQIIPAAAEKGIARSEDGVSEEKAAEMAANDEIKEETAMPQASKMAETAQTGWMAPLQKEKEGVAIPQITNADSSHEDVSFQRELTVAKVQKGDKKLQQFSGRLAAHMARISAKAKEIERIRAEKKRLLHEVYVPLGNRMQEELEEISDRILDHENRLLQLREHVAGLPGEVADVSERHEKMANMATEMQKMYDETVALSDESLRELLEARENLMVKAGEISSMIAQGQGEVAGLNVEFRKLSDMEAEAEGRLEEARGALARQQEEIAAAEGELAGLGRARSEIEASISGATGEIEKQKGILLHLEGHMAKMEKIGEWAGKNRKEYDKRMAELAEYVKKGDDDFARIRESVEANFVKRYLRELRSVSDSYEFELSQAKSQEKELERGIEMAKNELSMLIDEGKRLAQLHEMQIDEGEIEGLRQDGNERRIMLAIGSSAREQVKIRDYIRKAIGSPEEPQQKQELAQKKAQKEKKAPPKNRRSMKGKKKQ